MRAIILLFLVLLLFAACSGGTDKESFADEHRLWQEEIIERLKSETGWLNLAGLYWLREGEDSFGSGTVNWSCIPLNQVSASS
jgi:hypothetical protein